MEPDLPDPNGDFTQPEALTQLLLSIALEEVSLAHVENAEGEKIQAIVDAFEAGDIGFQQTLDLQDSVNDTLKTTIKKQMLLQFKLEDVLDFKGELELP
ncbi:hypothetical protein [Acetohalobium arabaticum]|uniref:Uncharacterized protein n=1 Tax=Acetohalobium arabaticum (strain ATCC 49924 / DSM 5501 / Z-7288) TaxID=574087 RepID=D9QQ67_ACEAZ|nr:hypothetical protein [Acetohalobium arabaticum]ADL12658.1 conserved hypothetical protein [Acetohalobium arabaticum DSM 5501]